jgi:hypothetical protein
MKKNCWEIKKCGREINGIKTYELGVCPAALSSKYDGLNCGSLGGRYCWKIAGTYCGGEVQGAYADKLLNCVTCDFFKMVKAEEGGAFRA